MIPIITGPRNGEQASAPARRGLVHAPRPGGDGLPVSPRQPGRMWTASRRVGEPRRSPLGGRRASGADSSHPTSGSGGTEVAGVEPVLPALPPESNRMRQPAAPHFERASYFRSLLPPFGITSLSSVLLLYFAGINSLNEAAFLPRFLSSILIRPSG